MSFSEHEEAALRTMLDEHNVRSVIERYFHSVDSYDLDSLIDCFTPDAYFEFNSKTPDKTALQGNETIGHYFHERRHHFKRRIHQISHLSVVFAGRDRARCDLYGISHILFEDRMSVRGLHYDDEVERCADGKWRIGRRIHDALWQYNVVPVPPFTSPTQPSSGTPA